MSKRRNPYRMIRKVAAVIGWSLAGAVAALVLAFAVATVWVRDGWGAWALTTPLIALAGLAVMIGLGLLVAWPMVVLEEWWKRKESQWR